MHVVVVGGGIVGLSCAHALAERGAAVTVCEAGTLGGGSTARAAGGIRTQFSTRVNVELSLASLPVWESFEERFGVDIAYNRPGYLFLAREDDTAAAFGDQVTMQRACGGESELLSPEELRKRWPHVRSEQFVAATYSPLDGFADPYLALQGYATAARETGVDVRTKTPVEEIDRIGSDGESPRFRVETPSETLEADFVVNAAGAWAARVGAMVDLDLPISPRRRQVTVVEPESTLAESEPLTIDLDTGSYFRPERDGQALVGGQFDEKDSDVDPDRFSESMDLDWAVTAVERAADCADYFGPETRIVRGWAGLYAVTPDNHAIVEESAPGVVTAAGFSGHGFQHAPATGRVVAELCLDGEASHVDVSALSSSRFEAGEAIEERNVA
ncbi:FAD-dependent oxidoreductase [Haloprofundus marisrubri]|uniref:FAD-dependent oxidoreductase n=1 Tax=Haloprofundus marisrubri TaxID=1514971 RepID=A0A0W1RDQ5_9EURY|nr:FAD-dependent oxidoreductase [Haloprofundus marisrubri]KTG11625.1 FAD-dependent oxidoreductase [Haloprofundus marisrubri]